MIIKVIWLFILLFLLGEGLINTLCGCHLKFKKGRKCKRWDCPNRKDCSFSQFYKFSKSDLSLDKKSMSEQLDKITEKEEKENA